MELKRIVSAAIAAVTMMTVFPLANTVSESIVQADSAEYATLSVGDLVYHKYSDHVELYSGINTANEVNVDKSLLGLPVTVIGEKAFEGSEASYIKLPESVIEIKKDAFRNCSKLNEIVIENCECDIYDSGDTICNAASKNGADARYTGIIRGQIESTAINYAFKYGYISRTIRNTPQESSTSTTTTTMTTTTTTTTTTSTTTTSKPTTTSTTSTTTTSKTTTTTTYVELAEYGKPVLKISNTEVNLENANGKNVQVTLSVEGADGLYCNTLIYVYFDERLKIDDIKSGPAVENLLTKSAIGDKGDFIVLSTGGSDDLGKDGVMWTIDVTLPEGCEIGDEFNFMVGKSKYGKVQPIFTNYAHDAKGRAMSAYVFGNGLASGGISIIENQNYLLGDANNDKLVDSVDASMVLREYALLSSGKSSFTDPRQSIAADVNLDEKIDSVDASLILAFYANLSGDDAISDIAEFLKSRS